MQRLIGKYFLLALAITSVCNSYGDATVVADDADESNDILDTTSMETSSPKPTTETGNIADRDRLLSFLFESYRKDNYPSHAALQFGISIIRFDVDDMDNLALDLWTRQVWNDSRLMWDPEEYGGHTVIRVPSGAVWKPDITLYNSAAEPDRVTCSSSNALIYNTGQVLWVPACRVKAYCNLTLDHAPYGEQTCTLKYGSWTFDGFSLDLQFYDSPKADLSDLWDITDWEITGNSATRVEKYYPCCKEPYPYLGYEFKFQRKGTAGINYCSK